MNKLLYIATDIINIAQPGGVGKKIISHCEVFSALYETSLICYSGLFGFKHGKAGPSNKDRLTVCKSRFQLYRKIAKLVKGEWNIYIRYPYSEPLLLLLLIWLKINDCKIVIEIPTYPYNKNHDGNFYSYFRLLIDKVCSVFLRFFVDRIVTYSADNIIFGIKTIKTINGVDFSKISPVENVIKKKNEIHLISVAHLYSCHGYDRVIKGLSKYDNTLSEVKVFFDIVGDGQEYEPLKDLIKQCGVGDFVKMWGYQEGAPLDRLYNLSDIAVNSLAIHRIGLKTESTLKAKEYCAKGLPIISSYPIDSLSQEDNAKYVLQVSLDDSPLDINEVVKFYDEFSNMGNHSEEIRKKSKDICDMSVTLKPIIDFFNK